MTLLTPLALLGLLLVPGLVALHLHRRRLRAVEVPSLLLWETLVGEPAQGGRRWRLEYVLLLLVQILALCALIFSLARPANTSTTGGSQVYVLDRGALMTAADPAPSRFEAARRRIDGEIQAVPGGTTVTVILADAQPSVLVSTTDHGLAARLLARVTAVAATPDLGQAIRLGAGFLGSGGHMEVVYAKGEALPSVSARSGVWSATSIGGNTDDQAIVGLSVRCVPGAADCHALATLRNSADSAVQEDVVINADGTVLGRQSIQLPANSATDLSFAVSASRRVVELYLTRSDLVSADNLAWSIIPGLNNTTVTIVGDKAHTAPIVRAFNAIPTVHTVVLTPSRYASVASGVPGLLVLAGWMPSGNLPATPNLLLVDPPRFPGAAAPKVLIDTGVSNEDAGSTLLVGVDLTSLDIPYRAGEELVLPPELHPVVTAASAPLIAAGVLGGRRVATIDFSPTASNLSQLDAFPVLMANIVQWASDWLPATVSPGAELTIDVPPATSSITMAHGASLNSPKATRAVSANGTNVLAAISAPGLYTVTEHGAWGERSAQVAADVSPNTLDGISGPIAVSRSTGPTGELEAATLSSVWWPWLGLIAAFAIVVEWLLATSGLPRRV
jgi:aerotolerance regulator-like protein